MDFNMQIDSMNFMNITALVNITEVAMSKLFSLEKLFSIKNKTKNMRIWIFNDVGFFNHFRMYN